MFAPTEFSRRTQNVLCMLMSAAIVTVSLALGAYGAELAIHPGYSVTVQQLQ